MAFICSGSNAFRYQSTNVPLFLTMCRAAGIYPRMAFCMYLDGLDWNGVQLTGARYSKRGVTLGALRDEWLRLT